MGEISEKVMQDVKFRFWKSRREIATAEARYFHTDSCEKLKWSLVSSTSMYSSKDSFEKLRMCRFQNCPWYWNLTKIWWRKFGNKHWWLFSGTRCTSCYILLHHPTSYASHSILSHSINLHHAASSYIICVTYQNVKFLKHYLQ